MMNRERRQFPRSSVERLTYIDIEPRNGGRILNISEEGLCFYAVGPVSKNERLHFRLAEPGLQIEASGELVWTDASQKKGGLRFSNLPDEAREQIRKWVKRPAVSPEDTASVVPDAKAVARAATKPGPGPSVKTPVSIKTPGPVRGPVQEMARPKASLLRERLMALQSQISTSNVRNSWFSTLFSTFYGGLATGLLVSTVVLVAVWFQSHRRQVGDSLVQWGQELRATSQPNTVRAEPQESRRESELHSFVQAADALSAASDGGEQMALVPAGPSTEAERPASGASSVHPGVKEDSTSKATGVKTKSFKPAPSKPLRPTRPTTDRTDNNISGGIAAVVPPSLPGANELVASSTMGSADVLSPAASAGPGKSTGVEVSNETGGAIPEKFLEVARYKQKPHADATKGRLEALGFHAQISQKSHLWNNSYYVLVGPYGDELEVEAAHRTLVSRGFKTSSFERGSRDFHLRSELILNGNSIPTGDCTITWEAYGSSAVVKFEKNVGVLLSRPFLVTAEGKLVKRRTSYDRDAVVFIVNRDGSKTLLEVQLAGTNQALVFPKSS